MIKSIINFGYTRFLLFSVVLFLFILYFFVHPEVWFRSITGIDNRDDTILPEQTLEMIFTKYFVLNFVMYLNFSTEISNDYSRYSAVLYLYTSIFANSCVASIISLLPHVEKLQYC